MSDKHPWNRFHMRLDSGVTATPRASLDAPRSPQAPAILAPSFPDATFPLTGFAGVAMPETGPPSTAARTPNSPPAR